MNCVITGNASTTYWGGGVYWSGSSATIINSTIVGNTAATSTAGVWKSPSATVTIFNSIVSSNTVTGGGVADVAAGCVVDHSYTTAPIAGAGNRSTTDNGPPQFIGTEPDVYALAADSPCIDVGAESYDSTATVARHSTEHGHPRQPTAERLRLRHGRLRVASAEPCWDDRRRGEPVRDVERGRPPLNPRCRDTRRPCVSPTTTRRGRRGRPSSADKDWMLPVAPLPFSAEQITQDSVTDTSARVSEDRIVWSGKPAGETDLEIFTWTPTGRKGPAHQQQRG